MLNLLILYSIPVSNFESAPIERLHNQCQIGQGEVALLPECTELRLIAGSLGAIADDQVLLSPRESTNVRNPLVQPTAPDDLYRHPRDRRAFSMRLGSMDSTVVGSITVKGGDLPFTKHTLPKYYKDTCRRIYEGQIPGTGLLQQCRNEFKAAETLQTLAFSVLRRPTHTAIPVRVSTISGVETSGGDIIPIIDYMNSAEYLDLAEYENPRWQVARGRFAKLGTLLLEEYGLQPAEYIYATKGPNIRVRALSQSRYFAGEDNSDNDQAFGANVRQQGSPFMQMHHDNFMDGDDIPRFEHRKDIVMRTLYHTLGTAYGFDAKTVLPRTRITDSNYLKWLQEIPLRCEREGISDLVLPTFIDRMTEVLALGHTNKLTFRSNLGYAGSFNPRNVTFEGTVLDLDTVGKMPESWEPNAANDLAELIESVSVMERMVSKSYTENLAVRVYDSYRGKVEEFGFNSQWRGRLLAVVKPENLPPTTKYALGLEWP